MVTLALEEIYQRQDEDPRAPLSACLQRQLAFIEDSRTLAEHLVGGGAHSEKTDTGALFEAAWSALGSEAFGHSVSLMETRMQRSGLSNAFFAGKSCFDGGCGSGRFSIAMARMGAAHVTAADIGQVSLGHLRSESAKHDFRIEVTEQDVTDLSRWPDGSFDFVASHGVLHHTTDCLRGVIEHFRITKPGGVFWLYLYGAGGLYWQMYDRLRDVVGRYRVADIKATLRQTGVRDGLIYTFLDNVLAPRSYHRESDILALLRQTDPQLEWRRAKGTGPVDDVDMCLAAEHGKTITGPEGEVRIIVRRS